MTSVRATSLADSPHRVRPRRARVLGALLSALAAVGALLVLSPAPAAYAAEFTFLVNSLSHQGDDLVAGDGTCLTSTGVCTLRAALQESNARPGDDVVTIAPAEDVDADTPGIQTSGTIIGSGSGAANWMHVGALTTWGDGGALFMATRPVTLDFQDRLGIASLNDANGVTAVYLNGPDVAVRNFSNVRSNETAFVVGSAGDGSTIENGSSIDPGSINLERFLWLANGADSVTVRNVEMGSLYAGGGSAIRIADGATINDLTLDGIRMYDPDTEAYDGFAFDGAGNGVLNRMRVVGSMFEGFGAGRNVFNLAFPLVTDSEISGNTFRRNNVTTSSGLLFIRPPATDLGTGGMNVIARNVFDNTGAVGQRAIFVNPPVNLARTQFAYRIEDNYFDGFTTTALLLQNTGQLTTQRNTFGPASFGGGAALDEIGTTTLLRNGTNSNSGITTWFPTAVAYDTDACTLDVTVTPGGSPQPQTPVTLDVYFTATTKAEVFLGRVEGVTAPTTITVPYTLGTGNIRLQTIAADGTSSQYSRVLAQTTPDGCAPTVTVEQEAGQADPTSVRDIAYVATFSEAITAELAPSAFSTAGSTAPGAAVTTVTRLSSTTFAVTGQANGSGTVAVSLPEDAVADPAGNPSAASTSVDNEVTYQSPLTLAPTALSVTEGEPGVSYTVTNSLAATASITVTHTVGDPSWITVFPTPLVLATIQPSAQATVEAVDDTIVNGTRTTTLLHAVSSTDPNFDGLVLEPIEVTVLDDDAPVAANSDLAVTGGAVTANGTATHTATATVRNSDGQPLAGVLVAFQVAPALSPTATSCTTAADGTCTIQLTSTTPGAHELRAYLNGTEELTGSPATAAFAVGAPDAATSTITASALTLPADGVSSSVITVTLLDASGNPLVTGGDTIVVSTTAGVLTPVIDNGDGTYTATLTAETIVGAADVSFTVNGAPGLQTVTINFVAGEPSASTSTIDAVPDTVTADGASASTVTVTLIDGYGNPVTAGGDTVEVATSAGTLGAVTDNGDGTYVATLTAATTAGTATLTLTVNGAQASDTATVTFVAGAVDAGASTIVAAPTSLVADGVSQSSVTVTLRDMNGNLVTTPATVQVLTDAGMLTAVADNGDGTSTSVLTAPMTPGTATLTFTVNGAAGGATASVQFLVGAPDVDASLIVADPTMITADGTSTSTITVTVRDAHGNVLTEGGADVVLSTDAGALGPVSDNGDGTYRATLTAATTAGVATIGFSVNGVASANTATVEFLAGAPAASASTIAAVPATVTADGVAASMITVTLFDANGNPITAGGASVVPATDLGTLGSVSDNDDGTYTAFLTSTVASAATVTFTVNGAAGAATTTVDFLPGAPDAATSTIAADPPSITADGASTSTVTVTAIDANGNPLTVGGSVITMATDAGTLGPVVDNGNGTYTATLTAPTTTGTATLIFTMDALAGTDTASVVFTAGAPDAATSTISATPTAVTADGTSPSVVTVTAFDANGNPVGSGGGTVEMFTSAGTLGPVTDNDDGTYTATLTSATTVGTATATFTVNGAPASASATVEFTTGAADPSTSTIAASPTAIVADGASTSTITVTLFDANGNPLTTGGAVVAISTTAGTLGVVTDNGDGTYTATLTASETAGTATLSFAVDDVPADGTAAVTFVAGAADADTSTIAVAPTSVIADGISTATITVTLRDGFGNVVTAGAAVTIAASAGTVSTPVDNADGTWTATLTSATTAGPSLITFGVDGVASPNTATIEFVPGSADPTASMIAADPTSITADGASAATITVTLLDANGNPLGGSGGTVTMATTAGTLSTVTDHADGTYTATLTSSTVVETATVSFTTAAGTSPHTTTVAFTSGAPSATTSTITADPAQLPADGASTSLVTVTLLDANGNPTGATGAGITMATSAGTLSAVSDQGDGTYSATLTSPTSVTPPFATVSFAVDGAPGTQTATVAFVAGVPSATTSSIAATPTTITADGSSISTITVTLRDGNGNVVTDAGPIVAMTSTAGTLSVVTDNGDGTYVAELTAPTTVGSATISFTVASDAAAGTTTVEFTAGPPDAGTASITASPNTIPADGASTSAVTVALFDMNGNHISVGGASVVVMTDAGTLTAVTDNGDGSYSATLTAPTAVGSATLTFTVDGVVATAMTTVEFTVGPADPTASSIAASPPVIESDGVTPSTITVTLLDANGNPRSIGGDTVTMVATIGALGPVVDNADGTYTATLTSTAVGTATISFTVNGISAPATATVVVDDTIAPAAPVITRPTNGARLPPRFPVAGTGEPAAIVDVRTDAGVFVCTAAVDQNGQWTCFTTTPLPAGATVLVATQTDPSGNTSPPSDPVAVVVDGTPPAPPVPAPTNGREFTGTAEPGSTVTVFDTSGAVLCVTTADGAGAFRCIPGSPVPEGAVVNLTATDAAGNESTPASVRVGGPSLTLDLSLAEPGDVQVANGRGFLPGELVSGLLTSLPVDLGTQVADAAGNVTFVFRLPADLPAGTHTVTLRGPLSGVVAATFKVRQDAPHSDPDSDPERGGIPRRLLPATGFDGMHDLLGWAFVLVVVGFGLTRRRTSGPPARHQHRRRLVRR